MCRANPPRLIFRTNRREILDWNNGLCQFSHLFIP